MPERACGLQATARGIEKMAAARTIPQSSTIERERCADG
jgi:hypothetical protein